MIRVVALSLAVQTLARSSQVVETSKKKNSREEPAASTCQRQASLSFQLLDLSVPLTANR
jgi:hypothetical protein